MPALRLNQSRTRLQQLFLLTLIFSKVSLFVACKNRSPEQLNRLIQELSSPDGKMRNAATFEIAGYRRDGEKAVGPLVRLLNTDPNRGIKTSAAYALRRIDTKEAKAALDSFEK
jgi:HEAT repeat protein